MGSRDMVSPAGFEPATTGIRKTALWSRRRCSDMLHSTAPRVSGVPGLYRAHTITPMHGVLMTGDFLGWAPPLTHV